MEACVAADCGGAADDQGTCVESLEAATRGSRAGGLERKVEEEEDKEKEEDEEEGVVAVEEEEAQKAQMNDEICDEAAAVAVDAPQATKQHSRLFHLNDRQQSL